MQRGVHVGSSGQIVGAGIMEPRPGQIAGSGMGMGPPSLPPRTVYGSRPSPGMQGAIASGSAPMATPDQFSPTEGQATSPVGSEPYSVRPGPAAVPKAPSSEASYPGSRGPGSQYPPSSTGRPSPNATEHPLASDAKYPTTQALITDRGRNTNTNPVPVAAKRSASQGSLDKHSRGARTTSPDQRYPPAPVHNHMENRSGAIGGQGDNTARPHPHKVQTVVKYKESGYSSSSTSGSSSKHTELSPLTDRGPPSVVARPAHPQPQPPASNQDLDNVPGVVRRPMSFVKAVELSDALASQEREREMQKTAMLQQRRRQQQQKAGQGHQGGTAQHTHPSTPEDRDRHNAYGSTYEISV